MTIRRAFFGLLLALGSRENLCRVHQIQSPSSLSSLSQEFWLSLGAIPSVRLKDVRDIHEWLTLRLEGYQSRIAWPVLVQSGRVK